jgi:hypothetical protein
MNGNDRKVSSDAVIWFFIAFLSAAVAFLGARQLVVLDINARQESDIRALDQRLKDIEMKHAVEKQQSEAR